MTMTYDGTNGITFPDSSKQSSAATALGNRLIDAGFIINQRGYVSGTALSAGAYAHDRWKAGASGCTYTFTQGNQGVPITITITAGSLQQVIEGCNVPEGGTYTMSWSGTAQGRVNGGSYSASPLVVTGLTAGANVTVEFNTGTLLKPKFETGAVASSFEYRPYGQELALCQRYYYRITATSSSYVFGLGVNTGTTGALVSVPFPVSMRTAPSALETTGTTGNYDLRSNTAFSATGVPTFTNASVNGAAIDVGSSGMTAGYANALRSTTTGVYLGWSAEL